MINLESLEQTDCCSDSFYLILMKTLCIIFSLLVLLSHSSYSQSYPKWFLYPEQISCKNAITVIIRPSTIYSESAIANGFLLGCDLLAKYSSSTVSGGQAFWSTENGVYAMGSNYEEIYDTTLAVQFSEKLRVINTYSDDTKLTVLVGDSSCTYDESLFELISIRSIPEPKWVETLPSSSGFVFGVGIAQDYLYEVSSWAAAEKNAYMSLARTDKVKLKSLLKQDQIEHQDLRNEEINVQLESVKILARWKDAKRKIFFVLARMKK